MQLLWKRPKGLIPIPVIYDLKCQKIKIHIFYININAMMRNSLRTSAGSYIIVWEPIAVQPANKLNIFVCAWMKMKTLEAKDILEECFCAHLKTHTLSWSLRLILHK